MAEAKTAEIELAPLKADETTIGLAVDLGVIRRYLGFLAFTSAMAVLFFAKQLVLPFILALLIALALSPITRAASRIGIPHVVTALLLIITVAVGGAVSVYLLSGPVAELVGRAGEIRAELTDKLKDIAASLKVITEASRQVDELAEAAGGTKALTVAIDQPGIFTSTILNAATFGTTALVALVLSLFLLSAGDSIYVKLIESFGSLSDKKRALRIAYGIEESVSHYLLSITLINAGLGVVVAAGLWLIGMPSPGLWGMAAFLFNFLPYFGALVGVVLCASVSIITFDSLGHALVAPAFYLLATSVEGQFVTPVALGRRFELNTVSVFSTVVFWAWMWGVAGALMAVPFLVCLKVACDHVPSLSTLGNLLGPMEARRQFDPLRNEQS